MAMYDKTRWRVEWVAEPCDEYGDIIDPKYGDTEREVTACVEWSDVDVAYWDIAKVRRLGNNDEGELERVYEYVERIYRDGRVVPLNTIDGLEAVEVIA